MKVALIISGNYWMSPYVDIYTELLNELNVHYDIISWNRDGKDKEIGYQYNEHLDNIEGPAKKLRYMIGYTFFVMRTLHRNHYDKLVIFGSQFGIFLYPFLRVLFNKKYIFDFRDLSVEQKKSLHSIFKKLLNHSYANVISSPAFQKYLPKGYDYVLSHNFNIKKVKEALTISQDNKQIDEDNIQVLTIGSIRDYESNIQVVKALCNKARFLIKFVGKGELAAKIQSYAEEIGAKNVEFVGYYPKEEEPNYIKKTTFINIFYPRLRSHDTALSNRFYNSLIYKKPMITTADTIQGDYASRYKVGVALTNCDNLEEELLGYLQSSDYANFEVNANELLRNFVKDYEVFKSVIASFVCVK